MNKMHLQRDAHAVVNSAIDRAEDYGMNVLDLIWDVTKDFRNNRGWSDAYAIEVSAAAQKLIK